MYSVETGFVTHVSVLKNVVLLLVSISVTKLSTGHELLLLVVEVIPEHVSVVVEYIQVIWIIFQLLHDPEQDLVFLVETGVMDLEGFIPDIWVGNREGHLVLVLD